MMPNAMRYARLIAPASNSRARVSNANGSFVQGTPGFDVFFVGKTFSEMETKYFLKPKPLERFMNKTIGLAVRFGLAPRYMYLLRVRGRRSGNVYSTPVNLLEFKGHRYLVGGRGHTAWSRNAAAVGEVTLIR